MREYAAPQIRTERCYEASALACAKLPGTTNPGSWHTGSAFDTFTGHSGPGFGTSESNSGSAGIGYGPGGTSRSYFYIGLCEYWIMWGS